MTITIPAHVGQQKGICIEDIVSNANQRLYDVVELRGYDLITALGDGMRNGGIQVAVIKCSAVDVLVTPPLLRELWADALAKLCVEHVPTMLLIDAVVKAMLEVTDGRGGSILALRNGKDVSAYAFEKHAYEKPRQPDVTA